MHDETFSEFQHRLQDLKGKIDQAGINWAKDKLSQHPHLIRLLEQIQGDNLGVLTCAETIGREEIIKTLTGLNDLIRLCSLIQPSLDPLRSLVKVPQIQTPFWRAQGTEQSSRLGNLVIVDTPGPNEAGGNLRLANVVAEQLGKSSMVLIVLDFTQLKTEAAEKVKQDVQKVIELRGKDNLYVLINKVDQRREGDMNPSQVRQFVAAELGLGDSGNTDQVFEVSARRAFAATNFMQELEQHPGISIAQMKASRTLGQEVFGIDWEEELEDATVEDVYKKAQSLWKKSGFVPFLEKAINALIERAAPKCMKSALNLSRSRLIELRDEVKLRSSAIAQDAEKLEYEVSALEADLHRLELCRSRLKEVNTIKVELQKTLNLTIGSLKKKAKVTLEDYFEQAQSKRAGSFKKVEIGLKQMWNSLQGRDYKKCDIIEFDTSQEVDIFVETALDYAKQKITHLIDEVREESTKQVKESCKTLLALLNKETKEIIERARTRLNEAFQVDLSLPPIPSWNPVDFSRPRTERKTRDKTEYQKKKYRPWWLLWIIELEDEVPITKTEAYYAVSLKELVSSINRSIDTRIININEGINNYLEEDFQERVDAFFANLDYYLRNYRDSLTQAQADQKLSLDRQQKLRGEFISLVPEATKQIEKADAYLKNAEHLMADKS